MNEVVVGVFLVGEAGGPHVGDTSFYTEHVSDPLGRLLFMRSSFEKFADASRLFVLPVVF